MLAKLAEGGDVAAALDSYNPPQQGFKALKKALAELRANGGQIDKPKKEDTNPGANVRVPEGGILRPGMKDKRVIALRQRLNIAGDKDNPLYDDAVAEAVKTFQTEKDLDVDGNAGPKTVRALNGVKSEAKRPAANPVDTVIVNMERWRWLPRTLGNSNNTYVVVNVPDYSLSLFNHGELYWKTKIVVGQPAKMTPMTSAEMKFITVNPTWNVPPSIIENEYLPALQQDPNALDRIGLKIYQDPDGTVHVYQPPGAANALGRIRFNFPNKFLVYQHDTPDKYLFKRDKRAFSHGCMRVENPLEYGTKLMSIEDAGRALHAGEIREHVRRQRDQHQFRQADPGAPDLSDRLRRRGRQAAAARGRLRPRRQDDLDPQESGGTPCRRHRDRARARSVIEAGAVAERHLCRHRRQSQSYAYRSGGDVLRLPVRRQPSRRNRSIGRAAILARTAADSRR